MLAKQAMATSAVSLLKPGDKADTAAATGAWTDASKYVGEIMFIVHGGTVTGGTLTPLIQTATDDQGAGVVTLAMTEGAWTQMTTSNDPLIQKGSVPATSHLGFVRFLGTIATGPAEVSCTMIALPVGG